MKLVFARAEAEMAAISLQYTASQKSRVICVAVRFFETQCIMLHNRIIPSVTSQRGVL